jgi:argininosuccinate synthase
MSKVNHYTTEERMQHLSSWKSTGISQMDYCKQHGIKYLTFNKWVYKSRDNNSTKESKKTKAEKKFIPIQVTETPNISRQYPIKVEIEFPDGTKVHIN